MKVPWVSKQAIAELAADVMDEYETKTGSRVRPPVPVEDIIERGLGLRLGFVDFEEKFGMKDVLGATYVRQRLIQINTALLSAPSQGRMSFTGAHEIGHWVLHRQLVRSANRAGGSDDSIFCRTQDAKQPIEWQADYFAACLLMPPHEVKEAWERTYGPQPLVIYNKESQINGPIYFDPCVDNWHLMANEVCRAGSFLNISKQSMIIRLQELGFIQNKTNGWMGWRAAASPDN